MISKLKVTKEHTSMKNRRLSYSSYFLHIYVYIDIEVVEQKHNNEDGVKVLVFCMSPDHVLYLYQVS